MSEAVGPEPPGPDDIDTETLLTQGDELLRASRRLLEELDGTIDLRNDPEDG